MASDDIQGTVTDSGGNTISNAIVALWKQGSPNNVITTQADSNGNYIFKDHPDGDGTSQNWHLAARDPNDSSRQFTSLHSVSASLTAIPDSGISRWTFDDADTESGTAIDSWGTNDGTINGVTTGASGANQTYATNESYSFDGGDDYIALGTDSSLTMGSGDYSIACWFQTSTVANQVFIACDDNSSSNGYYFLFLRDEGDVRFTLSSDGGTSNRSINTTQTNTLDDSNWYHIVCTWNNSNDDITIYVDGSEDSGAMDTTGAGGNSIDIGTAGNIGRRPISNDLYNAGNLDDVRLYNKELTATEVSNLYNNGSIL